MKVSFRRYLVWCHGGCFLNGGSYSLCCSVLRLQPNLGIEDVIAELDNLELIKACVEEIRC